MSDFSDALQDLPPDIAQQFKDLHDSATGTSAAKTQNPAYDPSLGQGTLEIRPGRCARNSRDH